MYCHLWPVLMNCMTIFNVRFPAQICTQKVRLFYAQSFMSSQEHHHYVLCVLPDKSCRPVRISSDRYVDLVTFCARVRHENYSLYYVSPSWIQRLPEEGLFILPEEFITTIPDFRLQFLPSVTPYYILRVYPRCDQKLQFAPWNFILSGDSDATLDDILCSFKSNFSVPADSFTCEFEPSSSISVNEPIMDSRTFLKQTKVYVKVELSQSGVSKGTHRMHVIKEIIQTEETYVRLLKGVCESFTEQLFIDAKLDPEIQRRTFKSIAEIRPCHERFLAALNRIGTGLETSVGKVFMEYLPLFRLTSPHVSNFGKAQKEIRSILMSNKAFANSVKNILKTVFDDKETIDGLMVSPVQRIPRYPLLLKELLKGTPEIHWDHEDLQIAYTEIQKLVKDLDGKKRDQDQLNFVADLQKQFGNAYRILESGRKGYLCLENVQINGEFKGSIYLFNDLILCQRRSPQRFYDFQLKDCKVSHVDGFMVIDNQFKTPMTDKTVEFVKKFQEVKRDLIEKMCTFGNALVWRNMNSCAADVSCAAMAEINGDLYLFGGKKPNGESSSETWIFTKGEWKIFKTKYEPSPRYCCSMHSVGTKLIVFGGRNRNMFFSDLLILDTETQTWARIDAVGVPAPRSGHAAAVLETQLWIFGGENSSGCLNDICVFDMALNNWFDIELSECTLPAPRVHSSAFWVRNENGVQSFAIFGGTNGTVCYNDVWMFSSDDVVWSQISTSAPPPERHSHLALTFDSCCYIIGGRNRSGACTSAYRLNMATIPFTWIELPQADEPDEFVNACGAVIDRFGLAVFCSGATYQMRLGYDAYGGEFGWSSNTKRTLKPGEVHISKPVYNPELNMVTAVVDYDVSYDFVLTYDENSLKEIVKVKDKELFWRFTSVLDDDGTSALSVSSNEFVLSEAAFSLLDKPEKIINEEESGHAILLSEMKPRVPRPALKLAIPDSIVKRMKKTPKELSVALLGPQSPEKPKPTPVQENPIECELCPSEELSEDIAPKHCMKRPVITPDDDLIDMQVLPPRIPQDKLTVSARARPLRDLSARLMFGQNIASPERSSGSLSPCYYGKRRDSLLDDFLDLSFS